MKEPYLWIVTAVTAFVALNTIWRLWFEKDRLWRDDLQDDDRAFAWRIVVFLIFPLMTLVDLKTTLVVCQWLGGQVRDWSYGLFWYYAVPAGLPSPSLELPVLFVGAAVQLLLALFLLPSLLFRPHPFLSTIIGYTAAFIFGLNLVADPLLALVGMGGSRWRLAMASPCTEQLAVIVTGYIVLSVFFLLVIRSQTTRLWFANLSRPVATEELKDALMEYHSDRDNPFCMSRLAINYERAGLRKQALFLLTRLKKNSNRSIFAAFLDAVLSYRRRDYKTARRCFLTASDFPYVDGTLKASLLAASACSAFADGDLEAALNLCERALEFDDASLVARMVKVDVFLRSGKKEQAGEEIMAAIRRGLDLDMENQIPLDCEKTLLKIARLQSMPKKTVHTFAKLG